MMQRFITTGTVVKLPYPNDRATRELTDPAKQEELLYTLLIQIDVSIYADFTTYWIYQTKTENTVCVLQ